MSILFLNSPGTLCSEDIDECTASECQNGATCIDGTAGYSCQCRQGYAGALCQDDVDDCTGVNCNNGRYILNVGSLLPSTAAKPNVVLISNIEYHYQHLYVTFCVDVWMEWTYIPVYVMMDSQGVTAL